MRRVRALLVGIMVAGCATWAIAGSDWHVAPGTRGAALLSRSAFLHGYLHGYEQGFHAADLDLQFGHSPRNPEKLDGFHHVTGYEDQFGDKDSFATGYYQGFRIGYTDGINLRPFRALTAVSAAARGLPAEDPAPSKSFDDAVTAGYKQGIAQGRRDAGDGAARRSAPAACDPLDRSAAYCDAYVRGYRFGYSDGYVTGTPPVLAREK